ncbi:MAG: hypothetical protein COA49_02490 [Bacteroidetes bacterium]|nr:MAG: hypothetical protein COA49_02490 [Bacteroidota bacterium]
MIDIAIIVAFAGLILRGGWAWHINARRNPLSFRRNISSNYSIIVCFHNEEGYIDNLIPSLLDQTPSPTQIILVDDGSTDGTSKKLDDYARKESSIEVVRLDRGGNGKKRPLSVGIERAKHNLILCTDADCIPASKLWAEMMTAELGISHDVKLGVSLPKKGRGLLGRFQNFEAERIAHNYIGMAESGHPYMGVGRNIAFTKSSWKAVGGFQRHSDLESGDDDLFVQDIVKTGFIVGTEVRKEAQCISIWPDTWRGWMRQMRRHLTTGIRYNTLTISLLSIPLIGDLLLYGGLLLSVLRVKGNMDFMHSTIWIPIGAVVINTLVRCIIFRTFLLRVGRPSQDSFWLLLEPLMGLLRQVLAIQGMIVKTQKWK